MKSDAPFRDAKAKLMEIRMQLSKRQDRSEGKEKRKKKKQKRSSETRAGAWSIQDFFVTPPLLMHNYV